MQDDVSIEGAGYKSSVKVDVKRLDFGDTCCLSLLNLTVLPAEAAALPLQALQVSLANVRSFYFCVMFPSSVPPSER